MAEMDANLASGNENSTKQKNTRRGERNQLGQKRMKQQNMAGPAGLAEPRQQNHLVSLPVGIKQEPSTSIQILKKPKMDMIPDDLMQQQVVQKLLFDEWKDDSEQLKAKVQHQNQLRDQLLHSTPDFGRAHYQQQRRNQLTQQASNQYSSMQSSDDGRCCRRLTQYIVYLRNRPKNNNIAYWRKFVSEFYANCAKERWCLSSYENIEESVLSVLSFPAMDAWCCDICGAKSGKGFEASYEILPRLLQMRFGSGELDQILHLEFPRGYRLKPGIIMLEYGKAVLETTYEQFRVAREGKLRVIFSHDLKILSWEFCARRHEEFLPRRLVAPQVNRLIDAANQYQSSIYDCALGRVPAQHLQANGNLFVQSGHQLTSFVELPMINDLGFSAKHGRCLEIAKVVNIMKDLIDFSFERKIGPIESLQTYPRAGNNASTWVSMQTEEQETGEQGSMRNVQTDWSMGVLQFSPDGHYNGTLLNSNVFTGSVEDRSMLPDYHQKLQREKLLNKMGSTSKYEQSFWMSHFDQRVAPSLVHSDNPGSLHNSTLFNSLSSSQTSEASKIAQQYIMDNSFDEVMVAENRDKGVQNALVGRQEHFLQELDTHTSGSQPPVSVVIGTSNNGVGLGNSASALIAETNVLGNVQLSGGTSMKSTNKIEP